MQEAGEEGMHIRRWHACARQTWSATAYFRMLLMGVIGLDFTTRGITFNPAMPDSISTLTLKDLPYRDVLLEITIEGHGPRIAAFLLNGASRDLPFLSAHAEGTQRVRIVLG